MRELRAILDARHRRANPQAAQPQHELTEEDVYGLMSAGLPVEIIEE